MSRPPRHCWGADCNDGWSACECRCAGCAAAEVPGDDLDALAELGDVVPPAEPEGGGSVRG